MKIGIQQNNFQNWLTETTHCRNVVFQALNLTPFDDALAALPQAEDAQDACIFLGCTLGPKMSAIATQHHGLVFPNLPGRPYKPFHSSLYTVEELFTGFDSAAPDSYRQTPDWLTYRSFIKVDENSQPMHPIQYVKVGADEMLARRLHDHFISDALEEMLTAFDPRNGGKGVVAVMGGHDRKRSDPVFSQVAKLSRQLTIEGFLVASGGGPGLMEAANLGAFFARRPEAELEIAIARMADPAADADKYSDPNWLKMAWEVRRDFKPEDIQRCRSLGVPTWFYGHEPPNVFASDIAKYFENSLREEGLLGIATHGVIFAQGNAGTAQEIFQDACQNYYDSYGYKSPMILLGVAAWNPEPGEMSDDKNSPFYGNKPAWPLLSKLARMKNFSNLLTLTDDPKEVLMAIRCFRAPGQA
ncbi:MAG: hypothetical protein H0X66_19910 [Verrucomicrobia bacterium]|nr:hypothetical protein [Verrucomicrobiota bacterium]